MIPNPDFKGKWFPDKIPNPAYKGEFKPRRIPHPAYFEDSEPWKSLLPVSAVALELWTMNKGVLFDNMLITHSEEEARDFAQRTWAKRHEAEKAEEKARSDKLEREKMGTTMVEKAVYYASKAAKLVEEQPIPAGVAIFSVFLALIALCFMPARGPLPHQVTARQPPAVPEHKAGKDAVVKDESPDSKPRQRTTRRTAKADS